MTIVYKSRELNAYPILHIDDSTLDLLRRSIPVSSDKLNYANTLPNIFDCYLGITGQSLNYLSLSKKSINNIFVGFVGALLGESFVQCSKQTKEGYVRVFKVAVGAISEAIPTVTSEIDIKAARKAWSAAKICKIKSEYYQGWNLADKSGKRGKNINLAWVWNNLGADEARLIYKAAADYGATYPMSSQGNFVPTLNEFLAFIEAEYSLIGKDELSNKIHTTKVIDGFCKAYFHDKEKNNLCIETSIKQWNDSVEFMEASLYKYEVFARPFRNYPYIPPKRLEGSDTKVSVSEDGVVVKDNLVIQIPLHNTDDEVIQLMFDDLNNTMNAITGWAQSEVDGVYKRFSKTKSTYDYMIFDYDPREVLRVFGLSQKRNDSTTELAYKLGLPTSYSLEPFIYLLINEHPKITEAFLLKLELFGKHGKLIGLEHIDGGDYFVGYKRRKGSKGAQQKIKLNDKSKILVEQIIEITDPLRKYLKEKGDDNYRYLFLSCVTGFCYPKTIKNCLSSSKESLALELRVKQFLKNSGWVKPQQAIDVVSRLSPTKFRATRGVQVFLETGSVKAMSEALGHDKYKPDLLSHYLPEAILLFFQARWVRIFQKGIVCEAMKDSPLLLRASNFKTIEELDKFILNHAINLPLDVDEQESDNSDDSSQVYVSIDENILTALLSIQVGVESAVEKVNSKALYWSKFACRLVKEIENNSYDEEMISALELAKENADAAMMGDLIYV